MEIDRSNCGIERATGILGDQWAFLILREFFVEGPRKFSDLQDILNISPNTLSARLKKLEEAGVLTREIYSTHPPRAAYRLTEKGAALSPVVLALKSWGEAWTT
ncbi:hypothetical protein ACMU_13630 [Actibacterium mucosum KCTC 23349]|uniref:HTH hxlR-type domain-containing protein n=1 Tax=Actibacterium mucosum KCTC 23349 TaxID=1454373 RepID=A0A037ZJI6_9RHOB|nr:helix-turn-helix domain-containing protein [Actibacterium mucosum]KAJ55722.1 hypothetical protein ACMU_13630 [Actibacterium mucosum KCTC 23349]